MIPASFAEFMAHLIDVRGNLLEFARFVGGQKVLWMNV
jgi:hypothetical protein